MQEAPAPRPGLRPGTPPVPQPGSRTAPPTPRKQLADLLADREAVTQAGQAAAALQPGEVGIRFVARLLPGLVPAAASVPEFVQRLRAAGWPVLLPGLDPVQVGDLFVLAGEDRVPFAIGFVGPLVVGGKEFTTVEAGGERQRLPFTAATFFLRLPCPQCDQAAGGPPRRG